MTSRPMTTTHDDGVKVVAWNCGVYGLIKTEDTHPQGCKREGKHTPLISALDEADRVDGLCPLARLKSVEAKHCQWSGHAHADKLRGLK